MPEVPSKGIERKHDTGEYMNIELQELQQLGQDLEKAVSLEELTTIRNTALLLQNKYAEQSLRAKRKVVAITRWFGTLGYSQKEIKQMVQGSLLLFDTREN